MGRLTRPVGEPPGERRTPGGQAMNPYKLRALIDHIRGHGRLPRDQFDDVLEPNDLLVWFGLSDLLTLDEQRLVKEDLAALADAEAFMDRLRSKTE